MVDLGGDQPRANAPVSANALMGIIMCPLSVAVILGPPASDCERDRDTLASARGGERVPRLGDPDIDEVGEKVG